VVETRGSLQLRRYKSACFIVTRVEADNLLQAQVIATKVSTCVDRTELCQAIDRICASCSLQVAVSLLHPRDEPLMQVAALLTMHQHRFLKSATR
jgi:hypothetical protein